MPNFESLREKYKLLYGIEPVEESDYAGVYEDRGRLKKTKGDLIGAQADYDKAKELKALDAHAR